MSSSGARRRGVKPAAYRAGQNRFPGRAKWWPRAAETRPGLMPQKRTRRPGPTTSRSGLEPLLVREVVGVFLGEAGPLVRHLVLGEAGVDRARLDAGVAVDALLRVDVELLDVVVVGLVGRRVDAVDRAHLDARVVLLPDAGLGDDVGHGGNFLGNAGKGLRTLNSCGH